MGYSQSIDRRGPQDNQSGNNDNRRSNKHITGTISINLKGKGFIDLEDSDKSVQIPPEELGNAIHGDTVRVEITGETRFGLFGKVREVIDRTKTQYVGVVAIDPRHTGSVVVMPDNLRAHIDIVCPEIPGAVENIKVLAEIEKTNLNERWLALRTIKGKVLKIIGERGQHNTEMEALVLDRGFDVTFEPEVVADAEYARKTYSIIDEEALRTRKDFRNTLTFTIDPVDAKDFDDAISLKKLPDENGEEMYEIGVHIADVSHFVRTGTALDKEARRRSFSVYLVDRTIPMLPTALSNEECSLNPNVDRFAFSAVFNMTKSGQVKSRWFGPTIIHSDKRFTYEEAQETILNSDKQYHEELTILNNIAKISIEEKKKKGAIDFESTEIKFRLDETGKPVEVYQKVRFDAHKLVEEFMLLANKEVAHYIYEHNTAGETRLAGVYRVHDMPDPEKLHDLSVFVKALGLNFTPGKKVSPKDIQSLINQSIGNSAEATIKTATLRSMAKAIYSTKNVGHFGLAFEYYTHFTSPIRRYPDLVVHRILRSLLTDKKVDKKTLEALENICRDGSQREIEAADAERSSIKYKQVEFLMEKVGTEFECAISGVSEWGLYVREDYTQGEGIIRLKDMTDDFYTVDEKNYVVVGEKTKKMFHIGDRVKVKLLKADLETRQLEFALANENK